MNDSSPAHGVRVELRRAPGPSNTVTYHVTAAGSGGCWQGRATVDVASGAVEVIGAEQAPHGAAELVRALLRVQWRSGTWPRRLTRWRATST